MSQIVESADVDLPVRPAHPARVEAASAAAWAARVVPECTR